VKLLIFSKLDYWICPTFVANTDLYYYNDDDVHLM